MAVRRATARNVTPRAHRWAVGEAKGDVRNGPWCNPSPRFLGDSSIVGSHTRSGTKEERTNSISLLVRRSGAGWSHPVAGNMKRTGHMGAYGGEHVCVDNDQRAVVFPRRLLFGTPKIKGTGSSPGSVLLVGPTPDGVADESTWEVQGQKTCNRGSHLRIDHFYLSEPLIRTGRRNLALVLEIPSHRTDRPLERVCSEVQRKPSRPKSGRETRWQWGTKLVFRSKLELKPRPGPLSTTSPNGRTPSRHN